MAHQIGVTLYDMYLVSKTGTALMQKYIMPHGQGYIQQKKVNNLVDTQTSAFSFCRNSTLISIQALPPRPPSCHTCASLFLS
jgi:hypothetical protein